MLKLLVFTREVMSMQGCVVFSVSRVEGEFCVSQFKSLSGSGSEGPESLPASKALVRHVFVSMCVCVCGCGCCKMIRCIA